MRPGRCYEDSLDVVQQASAGAWLAARQCWRRPRWTDSSCNGVRWRSQHARRPPPAQQVRPPPRSLDGSASERHVRGAAARPTDPPGRDRQVPDEKTIQESPRRVKPSVPSRLRREIIVRPMLPCPLTRVPSWVKLHDQPSPPEEHQKPPAPPRQDQSATLPGAVDAAANHKGLVLEYICTHH